MDCLPAEQTKFVLESRQINQTQIASNQQFPLQQPLKQIPVLIKNQKQLYSIDKKSKTQKHQQQQNNNSRLKRNIILSNKNNNDNEVTRTVEYSLYEELKTPMKLGNLKRDAKISNPQTQNPPVSLQFQFRLPSNSKKSSNIGYFWLNESSSDLHVTRRLDRDVLCAENKAAYLPTFATIIPSPDSPSVCVISFDVIVKPTTHFRIIKVTINLMDLNDNSPSFETSKTHVFISESSPVGAVFSLPSADDVDAGLFSVQEYSLISHTNHFELQVTDQADGSSDVRLKLTSLLDRENKDYYEATLVAMDGGRPPKSSSLLLEISVLDANDHPPTFSKPFYNAQISENAPPTTLLTTVTASDVDLGVNGKVSYSLSTTSIEEYGDVFGVDVHSGIVFLKRRLDYEKIKRYKLVVVAANDDAFESTLSSTAVLEVVIDDVNDNAPDIMVNNLTPSGRAEVLENVPEGMFVAHVIVRDADSLAGGEVTCSLADQSDFRLEQLFKHEYKVTTKKRFDREEQDHYELSLECRDNGMPALKSVELISVSVLDENEHSPYFPQAIYHASISESASLDSQVIKLTAFDDDSNDNSLLYTLVKEKKEKKANSVANRDNFIIGANNGLVRVNAKLDHERMNRYVYKVIVSDRAATALTGTTILVIKVDDENDNAPVFDKKEKYNFKVRENKREGFVVGRVSASDADKSEEFKKVYYAFERKNEDFKINETSGEIGLLRRLDREENETHLMSVNAGNIDEEGYFIRNLVSAANVTVTVADVNDNHPLFNFPNATHHLVPIDTEVATVVGGVVGRCGAVDADKGNNAEVVYSIVEGNDNNAFKIESKTCEIQVARNLLEVPNNSSNSHNTSAKQHSVYQLVLQATDSGTPSLSSTADLTIHFNHTPPNIAAHKEKGWGRIGNAVVFLPFFLIVLVCIAGCAVVVGCIFCGMFIFCRFSKKNKMSRALHSNKMYLVEKYKCSSESLDGMSIKPEKINSAKSLNAWPSTECRKNKMAAENNMVTVETGNSMAARRSMPNLGRGNYSKSSSYDAAFCNCHLYSLKAVNQTLTADTTITMTTNTATKSSEFLARDQTEKEKEKRKVCVCGGDGGDFKGRRICETDFCANAASQSKERIVPACKQTNKANPRKSSPHHSTLSHYPFTIPQPSCTPSHSTFHHPSSSLPHGRRVVRSEGSGGESDSTCSCSDSGRGLSEDERFRNRRGLRPRGSLRSAWLPMVSCNNQNEIRFNKSTLHKQQGQHLLPPPPQRKNNPHKPLQVSFRLTPLKVSSQDIPLIPPPVTAYQVNIPPLPEIKATLKPTNNQPAQSALESKSPKKCPEKTPIPQQLSQTQQLQPTQKSPLLLPQQPPLQQQLHSQQFQKILPQPQQQNLNFKHPQQNQLLNFNTSSTNTSSTNTSSTNTNIPSNDNNWHRIIANSTSEV